VSAENGGYMQLSPAALERQLGRSGALLVNVHVPHDGELPGTDLFVPFNRVANYWAWPRKKNVQIVVYCRSGAMSTVAARTLVELGYTNVRELRGGMNAWMAAGLTLQRR
jgi:rhodanese-related sulfurtransferase